jgi:hypothetical protein
MLFWTKKTKKLRKRPFWWNVLQQLQRKKYLLILTTVSFFGAALFGGNRIYKKTMWSPTYTISKVVFAPESVNALRSIELYTAISDALQWKNYFRTKWFFRNDLVSDIQQLHPLVKDMSIENSAPWTAYITITFQQPALLRQTPSEFFVSYEEDIYPVSQESILTAWLTPIQLPKFSSGRTDINGVYRSLREEDLVKRIQQLTTYLSTWTISELIYQPWGKRLFVTYKGKRVYFNLQKDMLLQIDKLLALEDHRAWFADVRTIDVGSRDEAVVQ